MPIRNVFEHVMEVAKTIQHLQVNDLKAELADEEEVLLLDIREIQELVGGFGAWQEAGETVEDFAAGSNWMRRE